MLMTKEMKMALLKQDKSKAENATVKPAAAAAKPVVKRPDVESDPAADAAADGADTVTAETPAAPAAAAAAPAAAPAAASTAVAHAPAQGAVALSTKLVPVLDGLKDALRVDYNTLARLQVNQGNYLLFDMAKKAIGDIVDFELLSFQDNFVISPGEDGEEALQFVKYSNDGKTTQDGFDVPEYLAKLKAEGYEKASVKPRCVLVVNLLGSSKDGNDEHYEKLYQIDLAPTSKSKFDAFRAQTAFDVTRGRKTAEQAVRIRSSVNTVTKGSNTWSVADFTYGPAA